MLKQFRRKVLVFGENATAQLIMDQLQAEGFESWQKPGFRLPMLSDPNSLQAIRKILAEFSEECLDSSTLGFVHPGVNLWAERSELPDIAQEFGLTVFCPPMRVISLFYHRLSFLAEADSLGIPHLVLSFDPMNTVREIEKFIQSSAHSFPFVLRAARGGGYLSSFLVQSPQALAKAVPLWCDQLRWSQGEVILFVERSLESARRFVVPFARFQGGRTQFFPIVDSSLQFNYRKTIEFCPSSHIDTEVRENLNHWTSQFINRCGFIGVGAMEFLVDGDRAFLVEGLARLNTSFPLWEKVAGTHAISWQVATLERSVETKLPAIKKENEWESGMSLRLHVEDPLLHLPQPGMIRRMIAGSEWCLNYKEGDQVSSADSGMFGFLVTLNGNRNQCLSLARMALSEFWVEGSLQVNTHFLFELMDHPRVRAEFFHTQFIDEEFVPSLYVSPEVKTLAARICLQVLRKVGVADEDQTWGEQLVPEFWIADDTRIPSQEVDRISLKWSQGPEYWFLQGMGGVSGVLERASQFFTPVCAFPRGHRWLVTVGHEYTQIRLPSQVSREGKSVRLLSALVGGRVHGLFFLPSVDVPAHEVLVIIESFGIFVPHSFPISSRVIRWTVSAEDRVSVGQELAEVEIAYLKT